MAARRSLTPEQIRTTYARYRISLDRARQNGEVRVRCLFHEDNNPSMSINVKTGQWHCFAGCGGGSIFQFVTKKDGVDHSTAVATVYGSEPKITSKIHATYDYRDEAGVLLFQAIRFVPKKFAQRRPDPCNSSRWVNNLNGVRRVPYRLPELIATAKENSETNPVFIVEGEKDVESLRNLGLIATTSSCGSSSAKQWEQPAFTQPFKDLHVAVLPDRDRPGALFADFVCHSLYKLVRSIRLLQLPGETVKDATDWIDAGGDRAKLLQLVKTDPRVETDFQSFH